MFSGGRGTASLSKAFVAHPQIDLFLLVNAYDDGLSSGRLRRFIPGLLGPSDIRKNVAHLISDSDRSIEIGHQKSAPLTDLARLCRYYLACSDQNTMDVSTWAKSNFDDLDYGELSSLPLHTDDLLADAHVFYKSLSL